MSQTAEQNGGPATGGISHLADHLFRHEAAKLISILTGMFGINRLQLAEDVVQEALIRALRTWPYTGIPKNPAAWLTQTAKNLALDVIRREKLFHDKESQIIAFLEQWPTDADDGTSPTFDNEIRDGRLRLMFACCHPKLAPEDQTALALKTLCAFSPGEIAKAFLTSEAAIAKRLTRAKKKIRDEQIPFEIPAGEQLSRRLDAVLQTLYLLFNEGYKASSGDDLIKEDLCHEAIRLTTSLAEHPAGNQPRTHALIALMLLSAARLRARTDSEGALLRLKDQDRSAWDGTMIARGMSYLGQSAVGKELSAYHLQAGIAACHCLAADYASTDWPKILSLYDELLAMDTSPVIALNRAVAVANVHGPKAGIEAIESIHNRGQLACYYLWYAVRGEFERQLDNFPAAVANFRKALALTDLKSEQSFLSERIRESQERSLRIVA